MYANSKAVNFEQNYSTMSLVINPSSSSKLNPIQLHLLELFSKEMTENELLEIRELLVKYYRHKVDAEMDGIWEKRRFTQKSFKAATENLHLRRKRPTSE